MLLKILYKDDPGPISIVLLNGQNLTVIREHYGHSAKSLAMDIAV